MSYDSEIAALADVTSGQTLAEAGGVGHAAVENRQNAALRELAAYLDVRGTAKALRIVETATGVWSADPPARTAGQYPCEFVGWSDPADVTNGVDTPANINDTDIWTQVSAS